MYTSEALIDIHERTHRSVAQLVEHCRGFTEEELSRKIEGFGGASLREQLQHEIGAQRYWIGVLEGRIDVDEDPDDSADIDALERFRERTSELTLRYLREASAEELNRPRTMQLWGGTEKELVPARVVLRTLTHFYHHQGQVAAMCRLLGRPIPRGMDFPL